GRLIDGAGGAFCGLLGGVRCSPSGFGHGLCHLIFAIYARSLLAHSVEARRSDFRAFTNRIACDTRALIELGFDIVFFVNAASSLFGPPPQFIKLVSHTSMTPYLYNTPAAASAAT